MRPRWGRLRCGYVGYGGTRAEDFADTDPALAELVQTMTDFTAVRTRCFDEFFTTAVQSGVRQLEIDQPGVLQFKADELGAVDAVPVANYIAVAIDLRQDWPTALREAGFRESGWLAEGLLPYLPPSAQTALFEHICAMCAPGSRLAVDTYRPEFYGKEGLRASFDNMDRATRAAPTDDRIYSEGLFFADERPDVADWLTDRGWSVTSEHSIEAMARLGRPAASSVDPNVLSSDFLQAELEGIPWTIS